MTDHYDVTTERLFLTPLAPVHMDAIHLMNADPAVMKFLGGPETWRETEDWIARARALWEKYGYSWWTIFLKGTDTLIGSACLQHLDRKDDAPLEIGWRLIPAYWGKGYATEAGQAAIDFAFNRVGVTYVCAAADRENAASQEVMKRLGMRYVGMRDLADGPSAFFEKYAGR